MLLASGSIATAASFNCKPYVKAGTCPEYLICTDKVLRRADNQMASLYASVLKGAGGSAARDAIRADHRQASQERNAAGCDVRCLEAWPQLASASKSDGEKRIIDKGGLTACKKGEIRVERQCMPPEDASGFCGPGYRHEDGNCVFGYKAPDPNGKLPSWQIEAIKKGCPQGMAWNASEGCHETD